MLVLALLGARAADAAPTCQALSDSLGIIHGITFGMAIEAERQAWRAGGCQTRPQASAVPALCQNLADQFGILAGATFGAANDEVQKTWVNLSCNANAACQQLSNLHGIIHGRSWGLAPVEVTVTWQRAACSTRPAAEAIPRLCARLNVLPSRAGEALSAWQILGCAAAAPVNPGPLPPAGDLVLTDEKGAWLTSGAQPMRFLAWDSSRAMAAAVPEGFYVRYPVTNEPAGFRPALRYLAADGTHWEARRKGTGFEIASEPHPDAVRAVTELEYRDWQGVTRKAKTLAHLATEGEQGAAAVAACNRIEPPPVEIESIFYRDTEYRGRTLKVNGYRNPDNPDSGASGVGAISSVRLGTPAQVAVWEDRQYQGVCHVISQSLPNLKKVGWNDRISSFRFGRGCTPSLDVDFVNATYAHMRFRLTFQGGAVGEWHELWGEKTKTMPIPIGLDVSVEIQAETFTMIGPLWGAGPDYLGSGTMRAADVRSYRGWKLDDDGRDYTRAIWQITPSIRR